jgi:hypothetical protein
MGHAWQLARKLMTFLAKKERKKRKKANGLAALVEI